MNGEPGNLAIKKAVLALWEYWGFGGRLEEEEEVSHKEPGEAYPHAMHWGACLECQARGGVLNFLRLL